MNHPLKSHKLEDTKNGDLLPSLAGIELEEDSFDRCEHSGGSARGWLT